MSKKLKVTLGVLLLVAGFLVVKVGLYFKNSATGIGPSAVRGISQLGEEENRLTQDSDQDGIADADESYYRTDAFDADSDDDGYLDGEEVLTGFDPLGNDAERQNEKNENVTDNFTHRLLAGIYAGDLNPRSGQTDKYDFGMDQLALAVIDETNDALMPQLNQAALITSDDSKASQEEYLRNIAALLDGPFLNAFLSQITTLRNAAELMLINKFDESSKIFGGLALTYSSAYAQLQTVPTPPKWLNFHRKLLATFQRIHNNYRAMENIEADPLLALAGINDFANNIAGIDLSLIQELKILIQQEKWLYKNSSQRLKVLNF